MKKSYPVDLVHAAAKEWSNTSHQRVPRIIRLSNKVQWLEWDVTEIMGLAGLASLVVFQRLIRDFEEYNRGLEASRPLKVTVEHTAILGDA